jgi:hypothetical protein
MLELSMILTVYFHRLKINHDSHEFILESSTVAKKYYVTFYVIALGLEQKVITYKSYHF